MAVHPIFATTAAHIGSNVMTSNYTGIVFFAVLGMLIVLSTVYIPA